MFTIVRYHGFAIIELVVVLTILVILAVVAMPRFVAPKVETRSAATVALGGYLRTRVARSHALWLAQGQPDAVTLDGRSIAMTNGYPDATAIDVALSGFDGFVYDVSRSPGVFSMTKDGSSPIPNCDVRYAGAPALGAAPSIVIDTSGC